jgi:hypothetical protein
MRQSAIRGLFGSDAAAGAERGNASSAAASTHKRVGELLLGMSAIAAKKAGSKKYSPTILVGWSVVFGPTNLVGYGSPRGDFNELLIIERSKMGRLYGQGLPASSHVQAN